MNKNRIRDKVRAVIGWEARELEPLNPNKTVLEYLRNDLRLIGTKEGCAEGDCGACTVIIGELLGEKIFYKAINSCIVFLPFIDGKQILTIENIGDDILHPVQRALVDFHGTQCGFCTPGIVMSLVAHHLNKGGKSRIDIDEALAGNLCRCTGYGPIIDATQKSLTLEQPKKWECLIDNAYRTLSDWQNEKAPLNLNFEGMKYYAPISTEQVKNSLAHRPFPLIAAGMTDIGLWVTKAGKELADIVSILSVGELKKIKVTDNSLTIYAGVTYSEARGFLKEYSNDFDALIRRIGGAQIRNSGTICGNIANGSPVGDMSPPLIALGASVSLCSLVGRRIIPLEEFFIDYGNQDLREGEFVEYIQIPELNGVFRSYKISKRFDQDISAVLGAFKVEIEDNFVKSVRIAFGGMASTPKRAKLCEDSLLGAHWTETTIKLAKRALEQDFAPISDVRATKKYRQSVAKNLLERFFVETTTGQEVISLSNRPALLAS